MVLWVCPECGEHYPYAADDDLCLACLTPLESVHDHQRFGVPELTGTQRMIESLMTHNRGVSVTE